MQNQNSKFNFSLTPDLSDPDTTSIPEFESILSPAATQPDTSIQNFDYNENLLQPLSFSISDRLSDAELFYPAQYYQNWVERTNTPAVPSAYISDSTTHRNAADTINLKKFPDYNPLQTYNLPRTPVPTAKTTTTTPAAPTPAPSKTPQTPAAKPVNQNMTDTATKPQAATNTAQTNDLATPDVTLQLPEKAPETTFVSASKAPLPNSMESDISDLPQKLADYNRLKKRQAEKGDLSPQEINELNTLIKNEEKYNRINDESLQSINNDSKARNEALAAGIKIFNMDEYHYELYSGGGESYLADSTLRKSLIAQIHIFCKDHNLDPNEFISYTAKIAPKFSTSIGYSGGTIDTDELFNLALNQELNYRKENADKLIHFNATLQRIVTPVLTELNTRYQDNNERLIPRKVEPFISGIFRELHDVAEQLNYSHLSGTIDLIRHKMSHSNSEINTRYKEFLKANNYRPTRSSCLRYIEEELRLASANPDIEQRAIEQQPMLDQVLEEHSIQTANNEVAALTRITPDATLPAALTVIDNYRQPFIHDQAVPASTVFNAKNTRLTSLLCTNSVFPEEVVNSKFNSYYLTYNNAGLDNPAIDSLQTMLIQKQYPEVYKQALNYLNTGDTENYASTMAYLATIVDSNEELKNQAQSLYITTNSQTKLDLAKKIIASDPVAIDKLRPYFDPTKSDAENIQMLRLDASDKLIQLESEVESAAETAKYIKNDTLIQYLKPGLYIAGLKMLRMLGADNVQATINEINKGADDAIAMIDGDAARFIAGFMKDNAADIVLISAAFATGGTAIAPALARLEAIYGSTQKVQQIQETCKKISSKGLPPQQLAQEIFIALTSFGISDYVDSATAKKLTTIMVPHFGKNIAEQSTNVALTGAKYANYYYTNNN